MTKWNEWMNSVKPVRRKRKQKKNENEMKGRKEPAQTILLQVFNYFFLKCKDHFLDNLL